EQQRRILEAPRPKVGTPPPGASEPKTAAAPVSGAAAPSKIPVVGATWNYRLQDKLFPARQQAFAVRVASVNGALINELTQGGDGQKAAGALDAQQGRLVDRDIGGGRRALELARPLLQAARRGAVPSDPLTPPA